MSKLTIRHEKGMLYIFEDTQDFYEDSGEFPIQILLSEALATVELPGFGANISRLLYDLSSLPWVDKCYLKKVMQYLRDNFPDSKINWEETCRYFGDLL